jgi:hypothetical protein
MKLSLVWAAVPMAAISLSATATEPCTPCDVGPAHYRACSPGCNSACQGKITESCEETYYQNAIWPRQYIGPARRGICQATERMIANGWRRQNLLGKYDFDESRQELSEAGRLKVEWILTQAPPQRRTIYVQKLGDQEQMAARIEAVQELASNVAPSAGQVDVQETLVRDEGHPAMQVDAVFVGFSRNQPMPALPGAGGGSGGSSSSSSSSSSSEGQ